MLAGGHGVAPSYVNLESTRSAIDPPPAISKNNFSNYLFTSYDVKPGIWQAVYHE
jgi:hypothetical protein